MQSRRRFLAQTAAIAAAPAGLGLPVAAATHPTAHLRAAPGEAPLVAPDGPSTRAWLYNGSAPGPILRAAQGETLTVTVENGLDEPTTAHWHGLRVPVEMDGVPFLSQPPIAPGGSFTYRLPLHDAGTFWYHPHVNSSEQVGRGLAGVLIVDEPADVAARLRADRELVWAIDDWRLDAEAQLAPFGSFHDKAHGGRIGNVLTVNGRYDAEIELRSGERLRLRLANIANAAVYRLRFAPFDPWVVALDGQPIAPKRLGEKGLWLGSGQRADLILDVDLPPGASAKVVSDAYGAENAFEVARWRVSDAPPLRAAPPPAPEALPPNPVARPSLSSAESRSLVFEGGAMGGLQGARMGGRMLDMRAIAEAGRAWAINGLVPESLTASEPLLTLGHGRSYVVTLENRTRWPHPIHLHGHSFFVLNDGADPLEGAELRDTVLLLPGESETIAFVADNPGQWMLHCHVLEHQEAGMMGVMAVA